MLNKGDVNMSNENKEQPNFIPFIDAVQAYKKGITICSYYPNGSCYNEYSQKISLSRRTLEGQFIQTGIRKKRYFTNKYKKIGFTTIKEALPYWVKEAMDALLENKSRKIQ